MSVVNTIFGEFVSCTDCFHIEDCDGKESRDGCFCGEQKEE